MAKRKFLGEMLIDEGLINQEQLDEALDYGRNNGVRVGKAFLLLGMVTEDQINQALGRQVGIPYVDLQSYVVDRKVVDFVPERLAREYKVFPLFQIADTLTLGMADPLDVRAIDEVGRRSGLEVEAAIVSEKQVDQAIDQYYGHAGSFDNIVEEIIAGESTVPEAGRTEQAPIIRLTDVIIKQGVHESASDIHIEPDEDRLRVRYRIDGIMLEAKSPPRNLQSSLTSRIKVMSGMDIAETRIPQDGRMQLVIDKRKVEFRVSTFPTIYGENIVMRILDQSKSLLSLQDLGYPAAMLERYRHILEAPYGIVIVTGPTGSGKTTTLYASLNDINSIEKNVITLEDPVEYRLPLIRQTQINPRAGLTFASGLRAILRQDPDVIMVGEMRDLETAEIAFQAALTGHLVFSTLHTNDASGALARLLHLGIEPFLVASSTVGVIAQRLVRTICPNCKTPHALTDQQVSLYGFDREQQFFKGRGCKACRNSGYLGRTGIYELLAVDETMRQLILRNASTSDIRDTAREKQGMRLLREEGLAKAVQGITTLEEVARLTVEE